MTSEKIKINDYSAKFHKKLTADIRGLLYCFKSTLNYTNKEIAELLDLTEDTVNSMLDENWDGYINSNTLCRLFVISLGSFSLPGCSMTKKEEYDIKQLVTAEVNRMRPKKKMTRDEMVNEIMSKFGVETDDDMYNLLQSVNKIVDNDDTKDTSCGYDYMFTKDKDGKGNIKGGVWNGKNFKPININIDKEKIDKFIKTIGEGLFN